MPSKYVRPYSKGQKNDFNDAEAIAEAVQRPTMKFVATKTAEQLDLQALHRVRERLVSQRTGIINQIRAFMLERGIAVRQGIGFLRTELPTILATRTDALSPRMLRVIEEFLLDSPERCPHAIAPCCSFDKELPTAVAFTDEGKAKKIEGLRFSEPATSASFRRKAERRRKRANFSGARCPGFESTRFSV
jgi:hypothetical protein